MKNKKNIFNLILMILVIVSVHYIWEETVFGIILSVILLIISLISVISDWVLKKTNRTTNGLTVMIGVLIRNIIIGIDLLK